MKQNRNVLTAVKLLWQILDRKGKVSMVTAFVLCLLRSLPILSTPQLIACLTSKAIHGYGKFFGILLPTSLSFEATFAICLVICTVLWTYSTFARACVNRFKEYAKNQYRASALQRLLTPRKNMDLKMGSGEILHILESSCFSVTLFLDVLYIDIIPYMVSALLSLIYVFTINLFLGLGALAVGLVVIAISIYRNKMDKQCYIAMDTIEGKINNRVTDSINNLPFITFINSAFHERKLLKIENDRYYKHVKKRSRILIVYWTILYVLEYGFELVGLGLLLRQTGLAVLGIDTLILLLTYFEKIFSPLNDLGHNINLLANEAFKVTKLAWLSPRSDEKFNPQIDKHATKVFKKEPITKIEMRNIELEIGNLHKRDINVSFEIGQLTCIYGTSGCGKTTLVSCLLGLKEYKSGEIIINNAYQVNNLFYDSAKICLTLQNGSIFDRSVLENIAYPNNTLSPLAEKNIQQFDLQKLLERTQDLPNVNLQNTLSGGEKKRISFVRAISRRGDVYIFDEPTNDLDNANVQKVVATLEKLKQHKIVIVISHDKRILDIADKLYYLD